MSCTELEAACQAVAAAEPIARLPAIEAAAKSVARQVLAEQVKRVEVIDALISAGGIVGTQTEERARRDAGRAIDREVKRLRASHLRLVDSQPNVPTVRLGSDLLRVGDDASQALARDPNIFQRRGGLVQVVRVAATESDADRLEGMPEIREVGAPTLRERLSGVARWERFDGRSNDWTLTSPPKDVVAAVLARGSWKGVRPIVGVTETPVLRPDGSVLQAPGYDAVTGYVYAPQVQFPEIPERPDQNDATNALVHLREMHCDFPFRSDVDRDVPIAALLTMIGRPAIAGAVPGFVFDASTPGSGKSRLADTIAIVATGRPAPRAALPEAPEELEKVMFSAAIAGRPLLGLDNVDRPLCGGPIDAALTSEEIEGRYLGKSELAILPWRSVILVTGNNVVVKGDTQRRVLVSRLEPQEERPEERTGFRHPDLLGWTREGRTRLVCAALTILRAYVAAGAPSVSIKPWGSFEAWTRLVVAAIVWAGGKNVLDARLSVTGDVDPERAALAAIARDWPRLDVEGRGVSLKSVVGLLYPQRPGDERRPPDGFDELRDALEVIAPPRLGSNPDPLRIGHFFRKIRGRKFENKTLIAVQDRSGSLRWRIVASESSMISTMDHS